MDIRGIEVTNQLRSAIRAKLLELGVRYDEELPDYILVMVVNKKTRQQMHEDLRLFLEDKTTQFVEWLHDQVLKKLQKVTVARKKTLREFVPSIVVKQEEERKKRMKTGATTCNDDSSIGNIEKTEEIVAKEEKINEDIAQNSNIELASVSDEKISNSSLLTAKNMEIPEPQNVPNTSVDKNLPTIEITEKIISPQQNNDSRKKISEATKEISDKMEKRQKTPPQITSPKNLQTKNLQKSHNSDEINADEEESSSSETEIVEKRLKSCVNKPTINSVISIKKRLGTLTPHKKFDNSHSRSSETKMEQLRNEHKNDFTKIRDIRARRNFSQNNDDKQLSKISQTQNNPRNMEKTSSNVKERLGIGKNYNTMKKTLTSDRTIKNRLGPLKSHKIEEKEIEDDDDDEFLSHGPVKSRVIAIKRADNVEKLLKDDAKEKNVKKNDKTKIDDDNDEESEKKCIASKVIVTPRPLKPLQPLQKRATQSLLLRAVAEANRSVVRQKNPEPVMTDNKPRLKRPRPAAAAAGNRDVGKNLSVHLNATKRLVMEKIQVQLSTEDNTGDDKKNKQYTENPMNDEHMGVVMSLFQRSDDNQKFLVTLNGYNNNVIKDNSSVPMDDDEAEDDEERLEMEVIADEETVISKIPNDTSDNNITTSPTPSQLIENNDDDDDDDDDEAINNDDDEDEESSMEKIVTIDDNNENENIENVDETIVELPERKKRRKLSPIVYARSRSSSPQGITTILPISLLANREIFDKRQQQIVDVTKSSEKTRDKCRYWPNCTLGTKCSYHHPGVPCSAFPACKYGEKCIYKHPKCKFGLACTKLACPYEHPKQQCKYHPFCTKPGCTYSHPTATNVVTTSSSDTTTRAKFTWKRRD